MFRGNASLGDSLTVGTVDPCWLLAEALERSYHVALADLWRLHRLLSVGVGMLAFVGGGLVVSGWLLRHVLDTVHGLNCLWDRRHLWVGDWLVHLLSWSSDRLLLCGGICWKSAHLEECRRVLVVLSCRGFDVA